MRWSQLRRTWRTLLLVQALFLLVACSSGTSSHPASVSTPLPTPTSGVTITPTPTIPVVPSRPVHFFTSDHVQLAGLLFGHGKTAVICSHEYRTTKDIWSTSAVVPFLALRGYMVLAYDFRGNGDSAGQFDTYKIAVDLHAAIVFVRQLGATKVVLLGSSMGGTASLNAAASDQVTAVVTLSAPQDFGPGVSDSQLRAINAPKLFVNTQNDAYAQDTQHMYAVSRPPKEIHLYSGSEHGVLIFDYEDELTRRILNFITRYAPAS